MRPAQGDCLAVGEQARPPGHRTMQRAYLADVAAAAGQVRNLYAMPTDHHLVSTIAALPPFSDRRTAVGMAAAAELLLRLHLWLTEHRPKHTGWLEHLMDHADFAALAAHPHIDASACLRAAALVRRWLHPRGRCASLSSQQAFFDLHLGRWQSAKRAVMF